MAQFNLVLSAVTNKARKVGKTTQPGSAYCLQNISFDTLGALNHRSTDEDANVVTIFDETLGPENIDRKVSLLSAHLETLAAEILWLRHTCIFLDNARSTSKNHFLFSWGMEMMKSHKQDCIRFCFLVAGQTNSAADGVSALIANAYDRGHLHINLLRFTRPVRGSVRVV